MIVLGIETSCDETAAAVVRDARDVLSNVVASQHDLHVEYGGVVPEIASRAHAEKLLGIVRESVRAAGVTLRDIEGVSVTGTPGLIGALVVGVAGAKAFAWSLGVPIVGVDHVHAHLYSAFLRGPSATLAPASLADSFPALGLVASGGHTSMYSMGSPIDIERIGSTIDDAVGEAFDKAGVLLGLPYPGGPALDRLARSHGANDRAHDFPVSRLSRDSLDFSFSGLKTSMLYAVRGVPGAREGADATPPLTDERRRDLAASFQRAAVGALMLKIRRAIESAERPYRSLIVGGGVTANSRLRMELSELGARTNMAVHIPPMEYCVDNAAMIAGLGGYMLSRGIRSDLGLSAQPTTRRAAAR